MLTAGLGGPRGDIAQPRRTPTGHRVEAGTVAAAPPTKFGRRKTGGLGGKPSAHDPCDAAGPTRDIFGGTGPRRTAPKTLKRGTVAPLDTHLRLAPIRRVTHSPISQARLRHREIGRRCILTIEGRPVHGDAAPPAVRRQGEAARAGAVEELTLW